LTSCQLDIEQLEDPMVEVRVAITGHRPRDLVDRAGRPIDPTPVMLAFLRWAAARALRKGQDTVTIITGGALGIDQEMADLVTSLKDLPFEGVTLRSCIALPFPPEVQGGSWPAADLARLRRLVAAADEVIGPLYPVFSVGGLHARNKAMVDSANYVVGFWNGKHSGGTYACLLYAICGGSAKLASGLPRANAKPAYNALDGMRRLSITDV
jgi:uncharacterized phage-like protein YoqJ